MLGDITAADEIYIVCAYTDMRRAIDGLCGGGCLIAVIGKEALELIP